PRRLPPAPPLSPYTTLFRSRALRDAIRDHAPAWQRAVTVNHLLRAEAPALLARAEALTTDMPVLVPERTTALMPAFAEMHIYLTDRKSTRLNSSHVSISYAV